MSELMELVLLALTLLGAVGVGLLIGKAIVEIVDHWF